MTKEKLKSIIFNSKVVYRQNFVPFVLMIYFFIITEIITDNMIKHKYLEIILFYVPLNAAWIYPAISVIWCIANYIYKKRTSTVGKIDSKSLIISVCILAFDSYFMFALYLIADLSI